MIDEDAIKKLIREKRRKTALPYKPITDEFITTKEFALILGMSSQKIQRRLRIFLAMISNGKDPENIPMEIRRCFTEDKPVVYAYQGVGSVDYEYRIAIKDLVEEYAVHAQRLVNARAADGHLKPETLKKLKYLSIELKTDIGGVVDLLVNKYLDNSKSGWHAPPV